jgi:hypothetical protein
LTVVKPIPHRPSPINLDSSHHDKSHRQAFTATAGGADLASSPGSYRRPSVLGSASAKSAGLGVSPGSGPNGSGGDNWRDRTGKVASAGAVLSANASASASASARAPERTVGGFEKKEARDAKSASTATANGDNKREHISGGMGTCISDGVVADSTQQPRLHMFLAGFSRPARAPRDRAVHSRTRKVRRVLFPLSLTRFMAD